jgi:hypothetical protein
MNVDQILSPNDTPDDLGMGRPPDELGMGKPPDELGMGKSPALPEKV